MCVFVLFGKIHFCEEEWIWRFHVLRLMAILVHYCTHFCWLIVSCVLIFTAKAAFCCRYFSNIFQSVVITLVTFMLQLLVTECYCYVCTSRCSERAVSLLCMASCNKYCFTRELSLCLCLYVSVHVYACMRSHTCVFLSQSARTRVYVCVRMSVRAIWNSEGFLHPYRCEECICRNYKAWPLAVQKRPEGFVKQNL